MFKKYQLVRNRFYVFIFFSFCLLISCSGPNQQTVNDKQSTIVLNQEQTSVDTPSGDVDKLDDEKKINNETIAINKSKLLASLSCEQLPAQYDRKRFEATLLIDGSDAKEDYFLSVLDENMNEVELIDLDAITNKIIAGSTSQISAEQETIILVRDANGICKSAIYLQANIDNANQFIFNLSTMSYEMEQKKVQEVVVAPKQVDQTKKTVNATMNNDPQKPVIDDKVKLPKPQFTPETLSFLLDAAYSGIDVTYLSQIENNVSGRNELELHKWNQDIDISIIGNSSFDQRKMISESVFTVRKLIKDFDINILQNKSKEGNFLIYIGLKDYLIDKGMYESADCWNWQRDIYKNSGDIAKFVIFINTDNECKHSLHYIQQGLLQGLGLTGTTNRYLRSVFNSRTYMKEYSDEDLDILELFYNPLITSKMKPMDLINIIKSSEQSLDELDINKYAKLALKNDATASFSKFNQQEIDYLIEIAYGREFSQDATNLLKWEKDIRIHIEVEGDYQDEIQMAFLEIVSKLNALTPSITIVPESRNPNYNVFVGPRSELSKINPYFFVDSINTQGLVQVWKNNNNDSAQYARAMVINDSIGAIRFQEIRNILQEEITQGLGLLNDSYKYPESIFYELQGSNDIMSPLDRKIIYMMYDNNVKAGFTESQTRAIFSN